MMLSSFILCTYFFLLKRDETLQRNLLQKKLSQKKFLSEDLNKLLAMSKIERRKNEVPGSYVS